MLTRSRQFLRRFKGKRMVAIPVGTHGRELPRSEWPEPVKLSPADFNLAKDNRHSWIDPDSARAAMEAGVITKTDYLTGLMYHPDQLHVWDEFDRLEA